LVCQIVSVNLGRGSVHCISFYNYKTPTHEIVIVFSATVAFKHFTSSSMMYTKLVKVRDYTQIILRIFEKLKTEYVINNKLYLNLFYKNNKSRFFL